MSTGWIKIYRSIKQHWLWRSGKFQWWIDILLTVNHADAKVYVRGKLVECKRGQSVCSLETWGREWGVSKQTVKEFFYLLQSDDMVRLENLKVTTRLTVCNYDDYQDVVNGAETTGRRSGDGRETLTVHKQGMNKKKKNEEEEENKDTDSEKKDSDSVSNDSLHSPKVRVKSKPSEFDILEWLIAEYARAYEESFGMRYSIANKGKERAAAGALLRHYKQQYPDGNTDDAMERFRNWFPVVMQIDEPFIQDNMTLPIIASKFNEINKILRNGKYKKRNGGGATERELAELMARKFGTDAA